jgi:hypothetical protein
MLLVLALALQVRAAFVSHAPASVDSAAKLKLVARARAAESQFILDWRETWMHGRRSRVTGRRSQSLHCHYDEWPGSMRMQLIRDSIDIKSMCPIWFDGGDSTIADEAENIDNGLRPQDRDEIRRKRADLLQLLDSAFDVAPESAWIDGQRVRLYVDQGEFDRAAAASGDCRRSGPSYCALLAGYVLESRGDRQAASVAFEQAAHLMTDEERCQYLDIRSFLDADGRRRYNGLPCKDRMPVDDQFWWLSDPLLMQPGNERLAVHLYRRMLVRLHSEVNPDERFDWRPQYGGAAAAEMIVRYGWPATSYWSSLEDDQHFTWLGYRDSSVNASREYFMPRYHTTPNYVLPADLAKPLVGVTEYSNAAPARNAQGKWDTRWWPIEHFTRAASLATLDHQTAVFRRATGPLIVVVTQRPADLIPDSRIGSYTAALITMRGPTDAPRVRAEPLRVDSGRVAMSLDGVPGFQIVSAEPLDVQRGDAPAGRARFSITAPRGLDALGPREIAISDAPLFAPPDTGAPLPRSLEESIGRMLATSDLRDIRRVGVFFEIYGTLAEDPIDMTLRVTQEDRPGLLRRIGSRLGIADAGQTSIVMRWRDDKSRAGTATMIGNVPVRGRSIVIDLSQMKPGHYSLEIGAARPGESPANSRRQLTIDRK